MSDRFGASHPETQRCAALLETARVEAAAPRPPRETRLLERTSAPLGGTCSARAGLQAIDAWYSERR